MVAVKDTWTVEGCAFKIRSWNCELSDPVLTFTIASGKLRPGKFAGNIRVSEPIEVADVDLTSPSVMSYFGESYQTMTVPLALVYAPNAYLDETYEQIILMAIGYAIGRLRAVNALL